MIGNLRRKFVFISAVSVCLVFSGIFFFLFILTRIQTNRALDAIADILAANDGDFPSFTASESRLPARLHSAVITEETQRSIRYFTAWLDETGQITGTNVDSASAISQQEVGGYVQQAGEAGDARGWIGEYRYKILRTDSGSTMVFVNGAIYKTMANRLLFTASLVLVAGAVLILFITVVVSKWAVRPVAESYEKQRQFVTDANHELKTPLTLILSNLDIVESEMGKSEWLDDIRSEGERMGLLINQMVTLSRMDESGALLEREEFDLSDTVSDTVSEFQGLAEERGLRLTSSIVPTIFYRGDEAMIRRLLAILLDNAVKYCDAGGEICLFLSLARRRYPVLVVENSYRNVDTLELGRLFDRFYRADKARTFSGSFGIGLSIAKSIVKSHKGNIAAYKKSGVIGFRAELK